MKIKKSELKSLIKEVVTEVMANYRSFIFLVPDGMWTRVILPSITKNTTYKGATDIRTSHKPKSITVSDPNIIKTIETVLDGLGLQKVRTQGRISYWQPIDFSMGQ